MANESGAVKRVMFDGGYATFADAGKGASVQPYKFGGQGAEMILKAREETIDNMNLWK